ncbi:p21-activated protein kinase-interacting protein 1-like [Asterias amurensis]|uniref:p21-activated protein kinase-interacting protein 1-like n=1 Tax=Asterias amurensis TaxID=7602 RepID=UPI003AB404B2
MSAPTCLEIFVGCYERTTLGYEVIENEDSFEIKAKFTDNSHIGYVKTIAANRTFLATGSTDETIHLYNVKTNRELGALLQHSGSITSLCFHGDNHMLSSSTDGTLCIWNTESWELMKSLRAHKGGVNSLAIHPSGKLALSAGHDMSLRTWNLIKGRVAYTTNMKHSADFVSWSPDGELYIVILNSIINIYDITTATITCSIDCSKRVLAVAFLTNRILAVGGEGQTIQLFEISKGKPTCKCEFKAHENRVKGLAVTPDRRSQPKENCMWLVSVSSDSFLKVWSVNIEELGEPSLLASLDTTARLTCVAVRPSKTESSSKPTIETQTDSKASIAKGEGPSVKRKSAGAKQDLKKKKIRIKKQTP